MKVNNKIRTFHANRIKKFIEQIEETTPEYSASFIHYNDEDDYHKEIIENLDVHTNEPLGSCKV